MSVKTKLYSNNTASLISVRAKIFVWKHRMNQVTVALLAMVLKLREHLK
jgi:hypothetical protein